MWPKCHQHSITFRRSETACNNVQLRVTASPSILGLLLYLVVTMLHLSLSSEGKSKILKQTWEKEETMQDSSSTSKAGNNVMKKAMEA